MGRMPSRSTPRHLPSSHLSHPHPLSPSSSSLASIAISLGSSPQERVSISLPLPLASPAPSSYLRGGFFIFLAPPPLVTLEFLYQPPRLKLSSRSRSTPAQLRRQIRYVQYFIFLMTSDVDTLLGPQRSCPHHHQQIHNFLFMACTSLYKPKK